MKKFLVAMALLVGTLTVTAQPTQPKGGLKGFVTNGFWDNWELSVGAGANYYHWGISRSKRIGWEVNAAATKWVIPALGLRVQLQSGQHNYLLSSHASKSSHYYIGFHGDLMVNVSNWVRYRADRLYSAIPFVGFGLLTSDPFNDNAYSNLGAYAGILNKFRINNNFDVNLELKAYTSKPSNSVFRKAMSATVGVSYRFGNSKKVGVAAGAAAAGAAAGVAAGGVATSGFDQGGWGVAPQPIDVSSYTKEINTLKEEVAVAKQEVVEAKKAAVVAKKETVAAREAVENVKPVYVNGISSLVFFPIGQSKLSEHDKLRLDQFVTLIKNGDPDKVYEIEGHADSATGSARLNQRLSEARAKAVYDYFVSKGVDPKRLEIKAYGDKKSPYGKPSNDRVVIVNQ